MVVSPHNARDEVFNANVRLSQGCKPIFFFSMNDTVMPHRIQIADYFIEEEDSRRID